MATYVNNAAKNPRKKHTIRYFFEGSQREKSFVTKKEAMDFKADFDYKSREHIFVDPKEGSVRFRDAAERWVAGLTGADSSKRVYRMVLRNAVNPEMGDRTLRAVAMDRDGLEDFLKGTLPTRGMSASQVKTCYIVVRAVVNANIRSGKLTSSRINGISLPVVNQKVDIIWPTHEQLELMADQMPDNLGAVLWLMRGCGLRIGEALAVRWEAFNGGVLRISEQLMPDGSYGPLKHRKAGDFRDVPVPAYVHAKLGVHGAIDDRFGYVFPNVSRRNVARWFRKAADDASLPAEFTAHMLRHIFASVSLSNGVPITDVSAWLGHRNINMTYSIYGHLVPSAWGKARSVLDDEYDTWKETSSLE